MPRHAEVSPYDWMVWPDGALEDALAGGARRRDVEAYLGDAEFALLVPLAQAARRAQRDPDRVVHLIPGVMGSQLGLRRGPREPPDLLWVDPVDVQRGRLGELRLGNERIESLGPAPYSYLALKLRLEAAGYTVRWFDHDWRRGIDTLGARLAERVAASPAHRQFLVGHSMGGLIARAALGAAAPRITRIITLGTPHGGSYAALQALRGAYASVRRVVQLDPDSSTEQLTERVFAGFPSLYQMIPCGEDCPDLRDIAHWPRSAPHPHLGLLQEIGRLRLPAPAGALFCIAGYGYDTVTAVSLAAAQFQYTIAAHGDGTVTTARATLAEHPRAYTRTLHGELPRDAAVARAVIDVLETGRTTQLESGLPAPPPATRCTSDAELQSAYVTKLSWSRMTPAERHAYFESLNAPVTAGSLAAVPP